jgi:hypothetical protein
MRLIKVAGLCIWGLGKATKRRILCVKKDCKNRCSWIGLHRIAACDGICRGV